LNVWLVAAAVSFDIYSWVAVEVHFGSAAAASRWYRRSCIVSCI